MYGSDRKSNFSSPIPNNRHPSIPKSVDENGKSYKENDKKSRKSKSNPSRKKVLAETNESLDNQQKTQNLESKCVQKEASFDPSSGEIGRNLRPYDPSTNYLSPRPKFLRYNPKRHREIMLRKEKEGENDSEAPDSDLDSVSSCGSLPKLGGGEINESDDEFEEEEAEVEDERKCGLIGALQLLMLLLVLVLSTSYIVSMNSSTPSPVVQAVVDLNNGYRFLQDHVYEYANRNLEYFGIRESKRGLDMEIEESRIEFTEKVVEDDVEGETREEEEDEEIVELAGGEIRDFSSFKIAEKVEENEEVVSDLDVEEIVELDGGEIQDFSHTEAAEKVEENEKEEEVSDLGNSEMLETTEVSVSDQVVTSVPDVLENEMKAAVVQGSLKAVIIEGGRISFENSIDSQQIGDESGSNLIKVITENMESESILKAVIGLSLFLSPVIALVLLAPKFPKTRHRVVAERSFEPPLVPDLEEKPTESAANVFISKPFINSMEETPKETRESERFYRSLSHESRVSPIIELLGELEISEMSTSLKSCGLKNTRATETEISSKLAISSYPVDIRTPASFNFDGKKSKPKKGNEGLDPSRGKSGLRRSSRIRNRVTSP